MRRPPSTFPVLPRRLWAVAVLLAVLAMQSLGLVHAVSHGSRSHAHGPASVADTGPDTAWGHTLGSVACELLDQWAHGHAPGLTLASLALAAPAQAQPPGAEAAAPQAAPLRAYRARAPPRG